MFATSTTNSTVVSASFRVTRHWSVQGEAFRSRLVSQLNAENAFLQGNPLALNALLSQFNQWSFLFRVARTFNWGSAIPSTGLDLYTAKQIPITGAVEGSVYVLTANGRRPAPGVVIALESGRSATTDADGKYRLQDVPEGGHVASIDMEQLPADYNPRQNTKVPVIIGPRKLARADFDLDSLAGFSGKVSVSAASEFETLEGIVIRLEPGGLYTMTAKDGTFAFYNVPDGAYQARLDTNTLPPGAKLKGDAVIVVALKTGDRPQSVQFEIQRVRTEDKPIRRVFDKVIPQ